MLGGVPQPWDSMLGTPESPMGHPESWGEMGRSRGGAGAGVSQHPDTCPWTWLLTGEPTASYLPTKLTGTVREMVDQAPAGRCVTLRTCSARNDLLP